MGDTAGEPRVNVSPEKEKERAEGRELVSY
jgi:hypothetical protein